MHFCSVTLKQHAAAFPLREAAKIINLAEVVQPKFYYCGQPFTIQRSDFGAHGGSPFSQRMAKGFDGGRHGLADLDRAGGAAGFAPALVDGGSKGSRATAPLAIWKSSGSRDAVGVVASLMQVRIGSSCGLAFQTPWGPRWCVFYAPGASCLRRFGDRGRNHAGNGRAL